MSIRISGVTQPPLKRRIGRQIRSYPASIQKRRAQCLYRSSNLKGASPAIFLDSFIMRLSFARQPYDSTHANGLAVELDLQG